MKAVTPGEQSNDNLVHIASRMLQVKNGTQQIRNTPATLKHSQVIDKLNLISLIYYYPKLGGAYNCSL
jgi:hypothetical protein